MKYSNLNMNAPQSTKLSSILRRTMAAVLAVSMVTGLASAPASATSRIKDIADFEGIRDNLLVGYGLVE